MTLDELNHSDKQQAHHLFAQCCAASRWTHLMVDSIPYASAAQLMERAKQHWSAMQYDDYMEAFDGHPKIGDPASLKKKYASTHDLASNEQSSVRQASDQVIEELARFNQAYEEKFGYIFIVCATGKSAEEMLELVKQRIHNKPEDEILIAAGEQLKILLIRIKKMIETD